MCVCMYVCICVCMYACMCVCMYVRVCVRAYESMCMHTPSTSNTHTHTHTSSTICEVLCDHCSMSHAVYSLIHLSRNELKTYTSLKFQAQRSVPWALVEGTIPSYIFSLYMWVIANTSLRLNTWPSTHTSTHAIHASHISRLNTCKPYKHKLTDPQASTFLPATVLHQITCNRKMKWNEKRKHLFDKGKRF